MKRKCEVVCEHQVVWMGLCSACGEVLASEDNYTTAGFVSLDSGLRVKKAKVLELEQESIEELRRAKKGVLVFDLDHTLIHATLKSLDESNFPFPILDLQEHFKSSEPIEENSVYRFALDHVLFYVKLRPGARKFLLHCAKHFRLYVYTHGTVAYASVILQALDPQGILFGNRVIARESVDRPEPKRLAKIFPNEQQLVLVIDDRSDVWTDDIGNLIQVSPYIFFDDPDRSRIALENSVRAKLKPLLAKDLVDQQLETLQPVLDKLLALAFNLDLPDFRPLLLQLKAEVLRDRKIATSGIISAEHPDPLAHPVNVLLQQLGAIPTREDAEILIAASPHTERAKTALKDERVHVVHPFFLLHALYTLKTPQVENFLWKNFEGEELSSHWELAGGGSGEEGEDLLADLLGSWKILS